RRNKAPALVAISWAERSKTESRKDGKMERQIAARNVAEDHVPPFHRSSVPLEVLRLIDQHDRDIVLDRVDQAAGLADELFLRRGAVLERPLAFRADEDLQKIGRETHPASAYGAYPCSSSKAASRTNSAAKNRIGCVAISSGSEWNGPAGTCARSASSSASRPAPVRAETTAVEDGGGWGRLVEPGTRSA